MQIQMDVTGKTDDGRVSFRGRPTDDPAFASSDATLTLHLAQAALDALPVGGIVVVDVSLAFDPGRVAAAQAALAAAEPKAALG